MEFLWKDVEGVVGRFDTPALFYFEKDVVAAVQAFKVGMAGMDNKIFYAIKSCYNPRVLACVAEHGCGAEVMSELEYNLAIKAGFKKADILVNGLARTRHFLENAVHGGSIVIIDSPGDFEEIRRLAQALPGMAIRIGVRIQIDVSGFPESPYSRKEHKLGLRPNSKLFKDILALSDTSNVNLELLHGHVTINQHAENIYLHAITEIKRVYDNVLSERQRARISVIDIGGGFGTFGRDETGHITSLLKVVSDKFRIVFPQLTMAIEPGRSISNAAGYVFTKVLDIKQVGETHYAIVDAGMNVLIPIPDSRYRIINIPEMQKDVLEDGVKVAVCDRITSPSHVITTQRMKTVPAVGSTIILGNCGAYTDIFATPWVFDIFPVYFCCTNNTVLTLRSPTDAVKVKELLLQDYMEANDDV